MLAHTYRKILLSFKLVLKFPHLSLVASVLSGNINQTRTRSYFYFLKNVTSLKTF